MIFSDKCTIAVGSGFIALLLIMFTVIMLGYSRMTGNQQQMEHLVISQHEKINLVIAMHATVQERIEQALRMVENRDPFDRDEAFLRLQALGGQYIEIRETLASLLTGKQEKEHFKNISLLGGQSSSLVGRFIELISDNHIQQAEDVLITQAIPAQNALLKDIRKFLEHEQMMSNRELDLFSVEQEHTLTLLSYLVLLAAILSVIIISMVMRRISRAENALFAETVLQSIGDAVITTDATGKLKYMNDKAVAMTGHSMHRGVDISLREAVSGLENAELLLNCPDNLCQSGETRIRTSGGTFRDIEFSVNHIHDHRHISQGSVLILRDITERKTFQKELRNSQERLSLVMQGTHDGIWDYSLESGEIYFSERWKDMLGYAPHELDDSFSAWQALIHPDDLGIILLAWTDCMNGSSDSFSVEYRMQSASGEWLWIECRGLASLDSDNSPVRLAGSHTDITARKKAEQALFAAKEHAHVTLQSIGDAVITVDMKGSITYMNAIAENLSGWLLVDAKGKHYDDTIVIIDEEHRRPLPITPRFQTGEQAEPQDQIVLINREGIEYSVEQTSRPLTDRNGHTTGYVIVLRDVSTERTLKRQLYWQATHDGLTGLANRSTFEDRLSEALDQAREATLEHALLYMDLDQFKVVNDTCGHIAGDELLRQLSAMLKRNIRETDTLARLGGDEFGVLLDHCPLPNAIQIAKSLRKSVGEFRFCWDNKTFEVGVSIGVVPINAGSASCQNLMGAADVACYAAKDLGRNRVHVYEDSDNELSSRHGEMHWVSRITEALQQDRFILYKQAIVGIEPARHDETHYEILVRMLDDDGNIIPPGAFIPAAERYNLMPAIDRWVIRNLFSACSDEIGDPGAPSAGIEHIYTVNLSGNSVNDAEFLRFVRDQIKTYSLPTDHLCFEITETSAIANLSSATTFINELKQLGCLFALDDFGSGLSSFGYLKNLPVDFLKIDGQFIKEIVDDPIDAEMVRSINEIGHVMGMRTIAEFVENDAILEKLREIGVDFAQGYGIAKPEPFDEKNQQRKTAS